MFQGHPAGFDLAIVERRATPATFERGCALADTGHISWTVSPSGDDSIRAEARFPALNRSPFQVRVTWDGRSLRTRCTCPARRGHYCSHRVALAVLLKRHLDLQSGVAARAGSREGETAATTRLTFALRVRRRIDWFACSLTVRAGDESFPVRTVIDAWRRGKRFMRTPSHRLARVPAAWLEQHANSLEAMLEFPIDGGHAYRVPTCRVPSVAAIAEAIEDRDLDPEFLSVRQRLLDLEHPVGAVLPRGLRATLRPYQVRGYGWLQGLRRDGVNGILADDMGLGKTLQVLALLLAEKEAGRGGPSLVVAPTSVLSNWKLEAERYTPTLAVTIFQGSGRKVRTNFEGIDLVVTSYALVRRDLAFHRRAGYHYLVLDEAQAIKNPDSDTAAACRRIPASHRLAMTGTPIENRLLDLWAQFAFLMPALLGSRSRFRKRYQVPIEQRGDGVRRKALRARVAPFILRRVKEDVAPELPPLTEITLCCHLEPDQAALYSTVASMFRTRVQRDIEATGPRRSRFAVLEALLKLRLICCHPPLSGLDPRGTVQGSAKLRLFRETLQRLLDGGHKVLVFSQFVRMLAVLRTETERLGASYGYLDGRSSQRQERVDAFNRSDTQVFLVSLRAGGTGLNLTGADYVIHYDPWWNPAVEAQATGRAHRIGQTRPVFAYRLTTRGTVEEKILSLHARKRALAEGLLPREGGSPGPLTEQDIHFLLGDIDVHDPARRPVS